MQRPTSVTTWGITLAAAALLLSAVWWGVSGGGILSSGRLSVASTPGLMLGGVASHAELSRECAACHVPPWSHETMAERCLGCHIDVQRELPDTTSLHGMLSGAAECRSCHTEHRGTLASLTRMEGGEFPHGRFGFSLAAHRITAAGQPFTCASCHGGETFHFDEGRCESCHREYQPTFVATHVAQWGPACQECHEGTDRFSPGIFNHDRLVFPLTAAHARVECVACHREVRTLEGFRSAPTECIGCHRQVDPHRGEFGTDCASCHSAASWDEASFDHTFPLTHGARRASSCITCHQEAPRTYRTYTCFECHEHTPARIRAEHLEEGIRDFQDCVSCHPTGREEEGERRHRD
jgi:hypothetical protein